MEGACLEVKEGRGAGRTSDEGGQSVEAEGARKAFIAKKKKIFTETVELGVLVPYPEDGSEARDQRLPSVL